MKKAWIIACTDGNLLKSVVVLYSKAMSLTLLLDVQGREFENHNEMYKFVLALAKRNGFCTNNYHVSGEDWHSVIWCDVADPMYMDRYGLKEV